MDYTWHNHCVWWVCERMVPLTINHVKVGDQFKVLTMTMGSEQKNYKKNWHRWDGWGLVQLLKRISQSRLGNAKRKIIKLCTTDLLEIVLLISLCGLPVSCLYLSWMVTATTLKDANTRILHPWSPRCSETVELFEIGNSSRIKE